ncbi:hypothetical protein GCM10007981_05510 [Thermocladium modestius]|uniref:Uncharacterized protein n=2 Tax=Thermocladium modestius TaxID=62609 RepID=A0A830GSS0_9CREN|nr:hypothetical protein GCM10007981_05510 [Thermocladium modestius]
MTVVAPMVIWESKRLRLRLVYFAAAVIMGWGGIAFSLVYPQYYLSTPWVVASLILCAVTAVSLIQALIYGGIKSLALLPLILLQLIAMYQYAVNVATEYMLIPYPNPSSYLVYPMMYLLIIGALSLLAMSIWVKPRRSVLIGYAIGAIFGALVAVPMYQLLAYNRFMQSIMGEVVAMGLGILAPPSYLPMLSIVMGIYVFSFVVMLARSLSGEPIIGFYALAALIFIGTAFAVHALSIYFIAAMTAAAALANSSKAWPRQGIQANDSPADAVGE